MPVGPRTGQGHEDLAAKKWISDNIKADPKTVRDALASMPLVRSLDLIDLLHLAGEEKLGPEDGCAPRRHASRLDYRAIVGTVPTVAAAYEAAEAAHEALYGKMNKG